MNKPNDQKFIEQFESFFHNRTGSYCVRDNETVFHFSCAICKATKFLLKLVKTYEIKSIGKQSIVFQLHHQPTL